jgi:hypothetical protein
MKEGQLRYENQIPPGYKDSRKKGNKFGDLVVWKQIIDYAKEIKKPIILVSDEKKDDWWREFKGETLGPRPELIHEIKLETGMDFYMYKADQFIKYAKKHLGEDLDEEVFEEIKRIREEDEKRDKDVGDFRFFHPSYEESGPWFPDATSGTVVFVAPSASGKTPPLAINSDPSYSIWPSGTVHANCSQCGSPSISIRCSNCGEYYCPNCVTVNFGTHGIKGLCQDCGGKIDKKPLCFSDPIP